MLGSEDKDVSDTQRSTAEPASTAHAAVVAKPVASLIGIVSAGAALAIGHLVAAFVGSGASPYLAVGNTAIDNTPSAVKDFAVSTFGTYDKLALLVGMALVLVALAVMAGLVATRRALPGMLVIGVFGVLGMLAVAVRPDLGPVALLAPAASLVVGVGVFAWLHRLAAGNPLAAAGEDDYTDEDGRRRFLVTGAGVVLGAGIAGLGGQYLASRGNAEGSRTAVAALPPTRAAPGIPADADFAKLGTPPFLTGNQDFYRIDTALVVPQLRAQDWRLRIHGMVDRELTLSYADIRARQLVERTITLCCVSNEVGGPYISTANFLGVDLGSLLAEAGVSPAAEQLYSTSADGFTCGTPIRTVLEPDRGAMLAIGMNGQPLPVEHGFPARMVVPGLYGYVSATKWVTDMEVTTWQARSAYWLDRGWAEQAPIKKIGRVHV